MSVPFQTLAKYLGMNIDETFIIELISSLCSSSYFHLHKISSLGPYLSDASTANPASSLILSRTVHCNSTLSCLPSLLNWIQKVKNNPARFIPHKRTSNHPLLKQFHWFPLKACIHYKIAAHAFRHFENSLTRYLSELPSTPKLFALLEGTHENSQNQPKICRKQIFPLSGC